MMSKVLPFLRRMFDPSGFRGPVLTLLSGTSAALLLGYFAKPILTRLYSVEAFGLFDFFASLIGVLIPISSLRYEDALMQPDEEKEAAGLLWLCFSLMLGVVLLTALLLLWREPFSQVFGEPALAYWLWFVPPTLLVMRAGKLLEVWLIRTRQFRPVSAAQVTQSTGMVASRIAAALPPLNWGTGGLIGSLLFGNTLATGALLRSVWKESGAVLRTSFSPKVFPTIARRYARFPLFSMPSTLLSALVTRLPFLLLLSFFGARALGFFGLAFNVLYIPLSLVGGAMGQVFFVQAAEAARGETLSILTEKVHARLVMVCLFPTLLILLAGPELFGFIFSEAWRPAGRYAQYIGLWLMFSAIGSPLTRLFDVLERQRLDLMTSVVMFIVIAGVLWKGGQSGELAFALIWLGIGGVVVRLFQVAVLLFIGGVGLKQAARPYLKYGLISLPFLAPIALAIRYGSPLLTLLASVAGGLCYAGLVVWREALLD